MRHPGAGRCRPSPSTGVSRPSTRTPWREAWRSCRPACSCVTTRDIAVVAADALVTREPTGVVEPLGPRDLTQAEVAGVLGAHLGRDLPCVRLPDTEMVEALVGAGFSLDAAGCRLAMTRAIDDGRVRPRDGRRPGNTMPTAFADVVGELVG